MLLVLLDHGDRPHDVALADPLRDVDTRRDIPEQVVRLGQLDPGEPQSLTLGSLAHATRTTAAAGLQ
jgi:hypothetical protein